MVIIVSRELLLTLQITANSGGTTKPAKAGKITILYQTTNFFLIINPN